MHLACVLNSKIHEVTITEMPSVPLKISHERKEVLAASFRQYDIAFLPQLAAPQSEYLEQVPQRLFLFKLTWKGDSKSMPDSGGSDGTAAPRSLILGVSSQQACDRWLTTIRQCVPDLPLNSEPRRTNAEPT
eukprot:TRINITY_DN18912_c0_g1_i1.p1 TRINITY_DN18912_c0_g1~~TRINITY_DN18912_c0_g1_i1.p1  ORF type:complete len:132 (-),score=9.58 TRINITY_DN18912_c0_g1_i1:22-417(-)